MEVLVVVFKYFIGFLEVRDELFGTGVGKSS